MMSGIGALLSAKGILAVAVRRPQRPPIYEKVAERVSVRTISGSVGMGRLEAGRLELAASSA